jgi:hypothetical protein
MQQAEASAVPQSSQQQPLCPGLAAASSIFMAGKIGAIPCSVNDISRMIEILLIGLLPLECGDI